MEKQSETQTLTNVTRHIHLENIAISDTNPRKFIDEEKLQELADSIDKHGVIQPITVRPVEGEQLPFELVSGERRYKASQKAGLDLIPAYVKPMSDEAAFEAQCIENIQREDVHPLDEATGYQQMKGRRGMTTKEIAERMDKSVSYVTKRLKMNELIEPLAELFFQNGDFKIGHGIELARLDADIQEELHEGYFSDPESLAYMPTVRDLQDTISRKFMLELEEAIFDTEDEQLYPEAGPCTTCPKRSTNSPSLFPELDGTDRCTDKGCWQTKEQLQLLSMIEEYKDDPNYYFVTWWREPNEEIARKLADEDLKLLKDGQDFSLYRGEDKEDHPTKGIFVGTSKPGEIHAIDLPREGTKAEREEKLPRDQFLQQEIQRIEERKARKIELDREKVQKKIIGYLEKHFPNTKLKSDWVYQLTICWALYDGLGFGKQKEVQQQLGLRDEESDDFVSQIDTIKHLAELDNKELQSLINRHLMPAWLLGNCTSPSYLDPEKYSGASLMRKAGEQLIPERVEEYNEEQAEKADDRNARYDERLAEHREELEELQEGRVEDEQESDEEYPPTVQLLVDHVRKDETTWPEQANVTGEVLDLSVRYSQLTESQAQQVYDYLVEQEELEPKSEEE